MILKECEEKMVRSDDVEVIIIDWKRVRSRVLKQLIEIVKDEAMLYAVRVPRHRKVSVYVDDKIDAEVKDGALRIPPA